MNQTIGKIALGVSLLALLVGIVAWNKPSISTVEQVAANAFGAIPAVNAPAANTQIPNGTLLPNPSNLDYLVARVFFYVDGALGLGNGTSVPTYQQTVRVALTSGTSTPCQIANPFTATTTITNFAMNITVPTSTSVVWAIGTSTSAYSTTTTMTTQTEAASAQQTITWEGGVNNTILSSGNYIVAGATVGTAAYNFTNGLVLTGSCQATFITQN